MPIEQHRGAVCNMFGAAEPIVKSKACGFMGHIEQFSTHVKRIKEISYEKNLC